MDPLLSSHETPRGEPYSCGVSESSGHESFPRARARPHTICPAAPARIVMILGHKDGIYLLVPALIAVLVGGAVNAWLILVRLTD
jgi:hypothetical protein